MYLCTVKKLLSILFLLTLFTQGYAQEEQKQEKVSNEFGTFYIGWGYNRSYFTKSDLQIIGRGYDLTFHGIKATDNPSNFRWDVYFNPKFFTVPQFNIRAGFYFKDKYSVSVGYDHMKYITSNEQNVSISGYVDPSVNHFQLSGTYDHTPYYFDNTAFHYENSDGLNYFRFQFERTDQWYKTKNKGWFAINTQYGIGSGFLLTFNDLNWAYTHSRKRVSISGWGMSVTSGVRLDFFNHFYIQGNVMVGFNHLTKVRTRHGSDDYARQFYGFLEHDIMIGTIWYFKKKKKKAKSA